MCVWAAEPGIFIFKIAKLLAEYFSAINFRRAWKAASTPTQNNYISFRVRSANTIWLHSLLLYGMFVLDQTEIRKTCFIDGLGLCLGFGMCFIYEKRGHKTLINGL